MRSLVNGYIKQYFLNEISKHELYKQCVKSLHEMLRGNIVAIQNIILWGILVALVEIEDLDEKSGKELVCRLNAILQGEICGSFLFAMQIPERFTDHHLQPLERVLMKYSKGDKLTSSEIISLHDILDKTIVKPETVNNMLERQVLEFVKLGYEFDENCIRFDIKHKLFTNAMLCTEKEFLNKICSLIDCYNGKREFFVQIMFAKGVGSVSILG